jgi:glycosyltransferase involved in cell wall biosynthesis
MRLLLLNYEFPPLGGGASSATFHLAREYARMGHHVDVLTSRSKGQPSVERLGSVTVYRVFSLRKSPHDTGLLGAATYLVGAYWQLHTLLRQRRYDRAQFFFAVPTGLLAGLWRRLSGRPYVVSLRGSDVPGYDADFKLVGLLHRLLAPLTRRILKEADHVVANSQSLRLLALATYPDVEIAVATNGVCENAFHPAIAATERESERFALCVARLVKRKGIDQLLNALKHCGDKHLTLKIAGTGAEEAAIKKLARSLDIEDRVQFLGNQTPEALARLYQQAAFLVHPALAESFSMTLLEAMASGLPIVSTEAGGIPELVRHEENGLLCPPGDVEALARAMGIMAADPALRARFASANRRKILEQFTWDRIAQQYLAEFLDSPGPS